MKIAIIGSRGITDIDLAEYIPDRCTEIVSGGAKGVDTIAAEYAKSHGIKLVEFKPEYEKYKRGAPLKRNIIIAEYADKVIAFWDGKSKGTQYVIGYCRNNGIDIDVITVSET